MATTGGELKFDSHIQAVVDFVQMDWSERVLELMEIMSLYSNMNSDHLRWMDEAIMLMIYDDNSTTTGYTEGRKLVLS